MSSRGDSTEKQTPDKRMDQDRAQVGKQSQDCEIVDSQQDSTANRFIKQTEENKINDEGPLCI